jgi:hypothetical protein
MAWVVVLGVLLYFGLLGPLLNLIGGSILSAVVMAAFFVFLVKALGRVFMGGRILTFGGGGRGGGLGLGPVVFGLFDRAVMLLSVVGRVGLAGLRRLASGAVRATNACTQAYLRHRRSAQDSADWPPPPALPHGDVDDEQRALEIAQLQALWDGEEPGVAAPQPGHVGGLIGSDHGYAACRPDLHRLPAGSYLEVLQTGEGLCGHCLAYVEAQRRKTAWVERWELARVLACGSLAHLRLFALRVVAWLLRPVVWLMDRIEARRPALASTPRPFNHN